MSNNNNSLTKHEFVVLIFTTLNDESLGITNTFRLAVLKYLTKELGYGELTDEEFWDIRSSIESLSGPAKEAMRKFKGMIWNSIQKVEKEKLSKLYADEAFEKRDSKITNFQLPFLPAWVKKGGDQRCYVCGAKAVILVCGIRFCSIQHAHDFWTVAGVTPEDVGKLATMSEKEQQIWMDDRLRLWKSRLPT